MASSVAGRILTTFIGTFLALWAFLITAFIAIMLLIASSCESYLQQRLKELQADQAKLNASAATPSSPAESAERQASDARSLELLKKASEPKNAPLKPDGSIDWDAMERMGRGAENPNGPR